MTATPESAQALLSSENFGDRIKGINQLRELDPAIAFELIQAAVNDENTRVRYAAVSQIASLGQQNRGQALIILRDRLLNDPEPDVQAAAADSLGALKLTEAFEDLQQLYQATPEWLVQFSIVAALGELGDPRAFEWLAEVLNSGTGLVKTAAIGSLGELGDRRAVALIRPYASDEDWQIRHRVAQSLGCLGGTEAISALQTLSHDPVEQVAQIAQTSLAATPQ